jgi:single-stranded DNA-binding protein
LKKSHKVYVEGRLSTRNWMTDGQERSSTEIIFNDMIVLDRRPGEAVPQEPVQLTTEDYAA